MKTGTKIIGGAAIGLAIYKLTSFFKKASNLASNIYVTATPKSFKLTGATTVSVLFSVSIKNVSGINLRITNLISKLYLVSENGSRVESGVSGRTSEIVFKDGQTVVFDVPFEISYLTLIGKVLTGQVKQIEIVTSYDFAGQPLSYTSTIDFATFISKAKAFVTGSKQVSEVGNL